jgi:hypothetical protein
LLSPEGSWKLAGGIRHWICVEMAGAPAGVQELNSHAIHKQRTFQEEYVGFLQRYGVDYDGRYLW